MPLRDTAAMNASLDNDYGTGHGTGSPSSGYEVALFIGDPLSAGVEASGGGYARVTLAHSAFAAASAGYKTPTNPVQFPATTAAWASEVTHWALFSHADGTTMWDCGPLTYPLDVTAASTTGPVLTFAIYYAEILEP
jgi:hypothetical protein